MKPVEKLNIELSLTVLHSLINDYKEQKSVNHERLYKMHPWSDMWT